MLKSTLQAVGLKTTFDIPADEIFSSNFDHQHYGLDSNDLNRINVLKDFVEQYNREVPIQTHTPISDSEQSARLMRPTLRGLDHEELWVVHLNSAMVPIKKVMLTSGSLEQTVIDKRRLIKSMLDSQATGCILFHNHPSGNPSPSQQDIKMTEDVHKAMEVFDIKLIDHIIISDSKFFSFATESITKFKGE